MTWPFEPQRHGLASKGIETVVKGRKTNKNRPQVGVMTPNGYISSYSQSDMEEGDQHHSFVFDEEDKDLWENYDDNLRFILTDDIVHLKGKPSLSPFRKESYEMIKDLSKYLTDKGVSSNTFIEIVNQNMDTEYEGDIIGQLKDFGGK